MRVPRRYDHPSARQRHDAALLQGSDKRFWWALSQHLIRACSRPIEQGTILSHDKIKKSYVRKDTTEVV